MRGNRSKETVFSIIREKILYLELLPNSIIVDTDLAEELGVGRTPVRESLLALQKENLVDIYPQRGTFVAPLDLELIREVAYIRHVLECTMLEKLAREKVCVHRQVARYLYLQQLAVEERNQKEYVRNDHLFHQELFNIAGHRRSWEIIEPQYDHTIRFHILDFMDTEVFGTSLQEHKVIIDCIEHGDIAELRQQLEIHHDCELRTADNLLKKNPSYFK